MAVQFDSGSNRFLGKAKLANTSCVRPSHQFDQLVQHLAGRLRPFQVGFLAFRLPVDYNPQFGQTQGIGLGPCRLLEHVVGNNDGRDSLSFQVDAVSHGAGGTRASSADAHQGQIGLR